MLATMHRQGDFRKLLVVIVAIFSRIGIGLACSTDEDCFIQGWGNYSICDNSVCKCSEFFVMHPIFDECIKVSSFDQPCEYDAQCQGILGNDARCSKVSGSGRCECSSITFPDDVFHYEGKCYVRKNLDEPCTEDNQCIIGSNLNATNPLARCTENICSCLVDDALGLHSMNMDGICMVHDDCDDSVDISLLAIMISGSAVLILFIYAMYQVGSQK